MQELSQLLGINLRSLKDSLANQLTYEFLNLETHNKADIPKFLDKAMPTWNAFMEMSIDSTSNTSDAQGFTLLGDSYSSSEVSIPKALAQLRNGTKAEEVYTRPFKSFWLTLQRGGSIDDALSSGVSRIQELTNTDVERVSDIARVEKFANENRIVGTRRVLVGAVNCALCIVASTQLYHKKELKPIHPRCDCSSAPVLSFESGGENILDQDLLDQIHRDIENKFGTSDRSGRSIDYRKILSVHQHGEIGPMLTWRGDTFTGPSSL